MFKRKGMLMARMLAAITLTMGLLAGGLPAAANAADTATILPDGVTWTQVRDYIDANFPSRTVADAVYTAIHDSGQDYTNKDDYRYSGRLPSTPADVIAYYGISNPDAAVIDITTPLKKTDTLKGVTLLHNTGQLFVENPGEWRGLGFMEAAYTPAAQGAKPWETGQGPRIAVADMPILELPERPYQVNLPRSRNGLHSVYSAFFHQHDLPILREDGKTVKVTVDTLLTNPNGTVDLNPTPSNQQKNDVIHPTSIFNLIGGDVGDPDASDGSKAITADGNTITYTIPTDGKATTYTRINGFNWLYNYYANSAYQSNSIDYEYRVSPVYLNTVKLTGSNTMLTDLKFRKTDELTGKPIRGARFRILDKDGSPAKQATVNADGTVTWTDIPEQETDGNGDITVTHVKPGDYLLHETWTWDGLRLPDKDVPITVTAPAAASQPELSGGEGSKAQVASDTVHMQVDGNASDHSWITAKGNMKVLDGWKTVTTDGVYVRNQGGHITLNRNVPQGGHPVRRIETHPHHEHRHHRV
ncbi:prealbumin-like fold domain-containing protein [Bifidobacterium felsineum]|uniref:prealbumin-like fold domain-containing protein n=1 Tax=Bifidobacterium felsineum TaxID=2045440 RepID=UPI001BDC3656|nr:prealbumin-like fold domain-containing protein [Bifidobacterium felsineum]MBT1164672.1 hypothetical protein [Bifidobacterium felsineum]